MKCKTMGDSGAEVMPPFRVREPVEHGDFDLQEYVLHQARKLDYFWDNYDAEKTQQTLQGADIENGTFILRPAGKPDRAVNKFLTLSVRMDFAGELTKVWHFPVIISEEDSEQSTPTVYYSLTNAAQSHHNNARKTSIDQLMAYHLTRPLRGGGLPGICEVIKGLPVQIEDFKPVRIDVKRRPVYIEVERTADKLPDLTITENPPEELAKLKSATLPANTRPQAPPSPRPPPRTLPRQQHVNPSTLQPGTPIPSPRICHTAPRLPPRRPATPVSSETDSRNSSSSMESMPDSTCHCGLPLRATYLPRGWSVHRSLEPDTLNMLYFKSPNGKTAWALPPDIDNNCETREYLDHGRLNIKCFEQFRELLTYSSTSHLSNYYNYKTYTK